MEHREYPAGSLGRRRHPRGQFVCEHDRQRWHWNLEGLERELDLTRDAIQHLQWQSQLEDILIQHAPPETQPSPARQRLLTDTSLQLEETA